MKKFISYILSLLIILPSMPTASFAEEAVGENKNKQMNTMVIAMATDNNFVLPTNVAMTSILENANADSFYKFYILVSADFTKENEEKLINLESIYKGKCLINFFKMSNEFDNNKTLRHITAATFFRLRLPSVLQNEEKCLYLDGDIIVLKDLWELYNTDISDFYVAGVKGAGGQVKYKNKTKELNIPDIKKYVNAGILLMNLKKMRQDNIEQKFNEFIPLLKEKNLSFADQDVINFVCYEKIYNLPFKYNCITMFPITSENGYENSERVRNCYTKEEWEEAKISPVIIHYASYKKPWRYPTTQLGNLWWEYAQKTDYFKKIQQKYIPK